MAKNQRMRLAKQSGWARGLAEGLRLYKEGKEREAERAIDKAYKDELLKIEQKSQERADRELTDRKDERKDARDREDAKTAKSDEEKKRLENLLADIRAAGTRNEADKLVSSAVANGLLTAAQGEEYLNDARNLPDDDARPNPAFGTPAEQTLDDLASRLSASKQGQPLFSPRTLALGDNQRTQPPAGIRSSLVMPTRGLPQQPSLSVSRPQAMPPISPPVVPSVSPVPQAPRVPQERPLTLGDVRANKFADKEGAASEKAQREYNEKNTESYMTYSAHIAGLPGYDESIIQVVNADKYLTPVQKAALVAQYTTKVVETAKAQSLDAIGSLTLDTFKNPEDAGIAAGLLSTLAESMPSVAADSKLRLKKYADMLTAVRSEDGLKSLYKDARSKMAENPAFLLSVAKAIEDKGVKWDGLDLATDVAIAENQVQSRLRQKGTDELAYYAVLKDAAANGNKQAQDVLDELWLRNAVYKKQLEPSRSQEDPLTAEFRTLGYVVENEGTLRAALGDTRYDALVNKLTGVDADKPVEPKDVFNTVSQSLKMYGDLKGNESTGQLDFVFDNATTGKGDKIFPSYRTPNAPNKFAVSENYSKMGDDDKNSVIEAIVDAAKQSPLNAYRAAPAIRALGIDPKGRQFDGLFEPPTVAKMVKYVTEQVDSTIPAPPQEESEVDPNKFNSALDWMLDETNREKWDDWTLSGGKKYAESAVANTNLGVRMSPSERDALVNELVSRINASMKDRGPRR